MNIQNKINQIVIATSNKGKLKEFQELLRDLKIISIDQVIEEDFDVEETGTSFVENALLKARAAAKLGGDYCLADDSGIEVDALDGKPGIYSGRYLRGELEDGASTHGIDRMLRELQGKDNRKCRFVCSLVLVDPQGEIVFQTEEYWNGQVADEAKGENGFGFDPIVIPDGYEQTVAELGNEIKNQLSHRAQALDKLKKFLANI